MSPFSCNKWHLTICITKVMWNFFLVLSVSGNVACTCTACTVNVGYADSRTWALLLLTYRRVLSVIFLAPTATKENHRSPSRERKLNLFSLFSQPELSQRGKRYKKKKTCKPLVIILKKKEGLNAGGKEHQNSLVSHRNHEKWKSNAQGEAENSWEKKVQS